MALILYRPLFWLALAAQIAILLWIAYRLRLRWLPAFFLRLLLLAGLLFPLLAPNLDLFKAPAVGRQVLVVDVSDSVTEAARDEMRRQAQAWQAAAANRLIVLAGADVQPLLSTETWPAVDGAASDLSAALDLAADMHGGRPGKIILASDGVATDEAAVDEVIARLGDAGYQVDVIALEGQNDPRDLYAGRLWLPPLLWEGGPFSAILTVTAMQAGEVQVSMTVNGEAGEAQAYPIVAGANYLELPIEPPPPGMLTVEAAVESAEDPRPKNNVAAAAAQVFTSPHVLFVTETPEEDQPFLNALQEGGIEVETGAPEALTTNPTELESYQVVFLNNLRAQRLSSAQISALKLFVGEQGGGLIFLGGPYSYTLGGYQNSPLAPLLPVKMEPPPRLERPPVTFVIIFDRSSSMSRPQGDSTVIALAREAAIRAIEILNPDDYIGVMTYSGTPDWNVPLTRVAGGLALRRAQDTVTQVQAGGATNMLAALELALDDLEGRPESESGLILVLSDGKSRGEPEEFRGLAQRAREMGLRISTIALGDDEEALALMTMIAEEGGGRIHHVLNAAELPRIMTDEGQAASGDNVQEGLTALVPGDEGHPALAGINLAELPPITGYNGLTSKSDEGAEDILVSDSFGDPLLSGWQYGLGRMVAWMADAGAVWATDWQQWEGTSAFWSQIVRYALLNPSLAPANVEVREAGAQLVIEAQLLETASNEPYNWASPEFVFRDREGALHSVALPQVAPGEYRVAIARPEPGPYRGLLRYGQGTEPRELAAPNVVNYPAEWRPDFTQSGRQNLERWAARTGGDVVHLEDLPQPVTPPEPAVDMQRVLVPLMWALILSWPLEIAIRRRWLPWPT